MKHLNKIFLPTLLFLIALALRLYWARDFDGLYGQDAFAYYNFAISLRQSLLSFQSPEAFFWPLGYPILLTGAFAIGGTSAITGQMLNIVLGALLAPLLYALAHEMSLGHSGAFLAGLLMAFCGQAIQSSIVLMSDIPALFWAVLSAYFLFVYMRKEQGAWLTVTFLCLALAIITRWIYLALVPVWGLVLLYHWREIRWRLSFIAAIAMLLTLLPQTINSMTNPYPVLNHEWVVSWSPSHFWQKDFVNGDGTFYYESINTVFYTAPFYKPYYLSEAFLSLIALGFCRLIYQRNIKVLLFLAGWGLIPLVFLMGIPYQNIRFGLILIPVALVLLGIGADWLLAWQSYWQFRLVINLILGLIIGYGLSQTLIVSHPMISQFVERQQKDAETVAWAKNMLPANSIVYTFNLTLRLKQADDLTVYDLFNESLETLDAKWLRGQNDYLLINVWEIENQWEGRTPYTAFHWLYDTRGLLVLGRFGNYVLCRING
jgi:4-amino-4-deoxy-L-arabinose transferase-like glycosyltransferase